MKKLLFLSFLCIAISVDLEYESNLGPAYNAKHSKYYTYLPCTDAYVANGGGWLDDDEGADVPNGVSDCVDRLLWDETKKIYYDHCCYVRFQIDGEMHAGCIGLSEENYLDTSITIKRMEEGDRLIWTRAGTNSKIYQLDCFSSYLKSISIASILLLALFF